ncbi:MAG: hypothetical protein J5507_00585 [Clostridia bacterium]|nr:hypothetical protein [Clostridia bacterium]
MNHLMDQDEYVKESGRLRQTTNDSFVGCPPSKNNEDRLMFYVNHEEVIENIPFTIVERKKVTLHDVTEEGLARFEDSVYRLCLKLKTSSPIMEKVCVSNLLEIWSMFHSFRSYDASQTNDPYGFAQGLDISTVFSKEYKEDGKTVLPDSKLLEYFYVLASTEKEVLVRFK